MREGKGRRNIQKEMKRGKGGRRGRKGEGGEKEKWEEKGAKKEGGD